MLKTELYKDNIYAVSSDDGKFIINEETGYKCVLTIDSEENLAKYKETDEDHGTLAQEVHGDSLIRTYSENHKYLLQNETGIKYAEAIDVPNKYTYKETDEDIPDFEIEDRQDSAETENVSE